MNERRRKRRRSFPYVRSAVLKIGERSHVVALTDLGPEGAFLSTRVTVQPGQRLSLRFVPPREGREVELQCEVVWRSEHFDPATGRPAGVAVRFVDVDLEVLQRLEGFSVEGLRPVPGPTPIDRMEYRVVERETLATEELNRWGLDGWEIASALPTDAGVRLILLRRL